MSNSTKTTAIFDDSEESFCYLGILIEIIEIPYIAHIPVSKVREFAVLKTKAINIKQVKDLILLLDEDLLSILGFNSVPTLSDLKAAITRKNFEASTTLKNHPDWHKRVEGERISDYCNKASKIFASEQGFSLYLDHIPSIKENKLRGVIQDKLKDFILKTYEKREIYDTAKTLGIDEERTDALVDEEIRRLKKVTGRDVEKEKEEILSSIRPFKFEEEIAVSNIEDLINICDEKWNIAKKHLTKKYVIHWIGDKGEANFATKAEEEWLSEWNKDLDAGLEDFLQKLAHAIKMPLKKPEIDVTPKKVTLIQVSWEPDNKVSFFLNVKNKSRGFYKADVEIVDVQRKSKKVSKITLSKIPIILSDTKIEQTKKINVDIPLKNLDAGDEIAFKILFKSQQAKENVSVPVNITIDYPVPAINLSANFGALIIDWNKSEEFQIKVKNSGKSFLEGDIFFEKLPSAGVALKKTKISLGKESNTSCILKIDTSQFNPGDTYSNNIILRSNAREDVVIPLSLSIRKASISCKGVPDFGKIVAGDEISSIFTLWGKEGNFKAEIKPDVFVSCNEGTLFCEANPSFQRSIPFTINSEALSPGKHQTNISIVSNANPNHIQMDFSFLIAFPWTRAFLLAFLYALGFYVYFLFSRMIFYNFTIFRDNSYFTFEDFRDFQWFVQYIWEYSKRLIITFTGGLPLFLVICIYGIIILKRMYLNIKKTASNNFSQLIPFYIIFGGILILSPILIEILTIFAFSIFDYSMTSGGRLLPVPANAIFGLLAGFVYGFICGFIPRKKFKWYRFHLKPLFALSFYFAALFIIASTHTTFWRPSDGYRLPLTIKMPEFQKIDIPSLPDIPISKDIKISVGIYRYPKIGKFSILGDIKSTISEVINELINQKNKSNGVLLSILLQEEPHYSGKRGRELLQAIQSEDSNSPLYYKLEAYLNKLSKLSSIKENHSYGINNDQFDHNKKQKIKKTRKVHEL